jgi:hypothetical protein
MSKSRIDKTKSSKPRVPWNTRRVEIADSIASDPDNKAMVACSACVEHDSVCYYDREQSVKCAECLRYQRDCDGTFAMEEYRKTSEHKKQLQSKSRLKRREIARLRKVLAEAEEVDNRLQDTIAMLEEKTSRMLKREMLALGVLDSVQPEEALERTATEVPSTPEPRVAGDFSEFVLEGMPITDSIDWDSVWLSEPPAGIDDVGGTSQSAGS